MIKISKALLRRCVEALHESAQLEAGLSQDEYLITREETVQWRDAKAINDILRRSGEVVVEGTE